MINFRMLKLSDNIIWICMFFLILTSFLAIFSVTRQNPETRYDSLYYFMKQFGALIVGFICMAFFAYLDYNHLKKFAIPLYVGMLFLLAFVLFHGSTVSGAQRWISLGPLSFQPSEITKLVVIITLATFFDVRKGKSNVIPALLIAGVPFLLIFKQPDLGTALVIIAIALGMLIWDKTSPIMITMVLTPIVSLMCRPNIYLWIAYILILWGLLYFSRVNLTDLLIIMGINIGVGIFLLESFTSDLFSYKAVKYVYKLVPAIKPAALAIRVDIV